MHGHVQGLQKSKKMAWKGALDQAVCIISEILRQTHNFICHSEVAKIIINVGCPTLQANHFLVIPENFM